MSSKRLTKEDIQTSHGILNPVRHVVLAFKDDSLAADAVKSLLGAGLAHEDILLYTAAEATPRLRDRVRSTSESAGFGYEITLMRRYLSLAEGGAGWLIVYAPSDAVANHIADVAVSHTALCAVRYHRLATEDLI